MAEIRASEELLAAPLPDLIRQLGLAVADANAELGKGSSGIVYSIPEAQIEVKVAISISRTTELGVEGGFELYAFSVNASYKNSYTYSEEASSRIQLTLRAMPTKPSEETAPTKPAAGRARAQ